jgi:CarD family transcriptional regulator
MRIPIGDMKVMVPISSVESIGLREVVDAQTVECVLERMRSRQLDDTVNWNRRYRVNLDKIRSGDIYEVADVVRSLMIRNEEKGLSTGERKMLDNAKQILISELALARDMNEEEAVGLIEEIISSNDND